MGAIFTANFQNNISGFHPCAEKIIITNSETQDFEHSTYVLVNETETDNDIYNIKINCEIPYTFFRDLVILGSTLIIAIENYVYFFNLENKEHKQFKLDGYFERFHFAKQNLIIATHTHLSLFNEEVQRKWVSEKLAIEKLNVKVINDDIISGFGKWTDDIGSKEFSISMADGKSTIMKKKKKSWIARQFFD
jgi:hypothetical protein